MTATDPLAAATSAVPQHAALSEALADVERLVHDAHAAVSSAESEHALVRRLATDVASGTCTVVDAGTSLLELRAGLAARQAEIDVGTRMRDLLGADLADTHAEHADAALDVLRAMLDDVLDTARPLASALDGVTTPAQAIDADRTDAWREVGIIAERYAAVRRAQAVVVSRARTPDRRRLRQAPTPANARLVELHGHISYPETHEPVLTDLILGPGRAPDPSFAVGERGPDERRHRPPWSTGDPRADLLFVCRPDAHPWLPALHEFAAVADRTTGEPTTAPLKPSALTSGQVAVLGATGRIARSPALATEETSS